MKCEPTTKSRFTPITITLESPEEVAAVFAVLNNTRVAQAAGLPEKGWQLLKYANTAAGNDEIDYRERHQRLEDLRPNTI